MVSTQDSGRHVQRYLTHTTTYNTSTKFLHIHNHVNCISSDGWKWQSQNPNGFKVTTPTPAWSWQTPRWIVCMCCIYVRYWEERKAFAEIWFNDISPSFTDPVLFSDSDFIFFMLFFFMYACMKLSILKVERIVLFSLNSKKKVKDTKENVTTTVCA